MTPEDYLQHIDFAATTKLDFTPLFTEPKVFRSPVLDLCRPFVRRPSTKSPALSPWGFFLAPPSQQSWVGLVPIRKAGKLPNIKRNVARQRFVDYTGEASSLRSTKPCLAKASVFC